MESTTGTSYSSKVYNLRPANSLKIVFQQDGAPAHRVRDTVRFLLIYFSRHMTYTYKIIQYKNKPYSDNNEHYGSVALTDSQHEIKWVKNYNETLKTLLHYIQ